MALNAKQEELCAQDTWDFSDLRAIFVNCTLKRSPELSHTQGLVDISIGDHARAKAWQSKRSGPSTTTSQPACGPT